MASCSPEAAEIFWTLAARGWWTHNAWKIAPGRCVPARRSQVILSARGWEHSVLWWIYTKMRASWSTNRQHRECSPIGTVPGWTVPRLGKCHRSVLFHWTWVLFSSVCYKAWWYTRTSAPNRLWWSGSSFSAYAISTIKRWPEDHQGTWPSIRTSDIWLALHCRKY